MARRSSPVPAAAGAAPPPRERSRGWWLMGAIGLVLLALLTLWCSRAGRTGRPPQATETATTVGEDGADPALPRFPTRIAQQGRIVAIGDLHGDLAAAREALRLGGLLGDDDRWAGGHAMLVQTGDILDRGSDEREILELLERLAGEARQTGGSVHLLNGNHELMNVEGDFRYVSPGGFEDFMNEPGLALDTPELVALPMQERGRVAAFRPGGPWARMLSEHPVVLIVGDSLFVHGSLLPSHVRYGLERLNQEARAWLAGSSSQGRRVLADRESPVWLRTFGLPPSTDCKLLAETLAAAKVARMLVGHTTQQSGVTSACNGAVWRLDVGMGSSRGASPEAVAIENGQVTVLGAETPAR